MSPTPGNDVWRGPWRHDAHGRPLFTIVEEDATPDINDQVVAGGEVRSPDGYRKIAFTNPPALASDARRYFPVPTGADDAAELISRINAGENVVDLRRNTYRWQQSVALAGARIQGMGKHVTTVLHDFNGDAVTLGTEGELAHLTLNGQGASRTGKGLVLGAGVARQLLEHVRVIDFADYCLDFQAIDAGSQSMFLNCTFAQLVGTAIGQEAIHITDTQQLAATPRKFIGCESNGKRFIHLGGCNDLFIVAGGYIGEIVYTAESRGVVLAGARLGGNYTPEGNVLHIKGFNHAISGCDVAPNLEIDPGFSAITIEGNTYNNSVTDNSGSPHLNHVTFKKKAYTPTITTGGVAPTLGNGTLSGSFSRHGATVTFEVELTVGSTTNLGTGDLRFALPVMPTSGGIIRTVPVSVYDASMTNFYGGTGLVLVSGEGFVTLRNINPATGAMSATSPITFTTGDVIRLGGSYTL